MRQFRLPLDVDGEVRALFAGQTVLVSGRRNTITVDLPNLRAGVTAFRTTGGRKQRAVTMGRVNTALRVADLSVHFQLAGRTVARLGADARSGLLSRLLGVSPLEIRLSDLASVITAFWR